MSSHFQPAFDVIVAVPSMRQSKTASSPEIAIPAYPVKSRPWRRYSARSPKSSGTTKQWSCSETARFSSSTRHTRSSCVSLTSTLREGTRSSSFASLNSR